MPRVGKAKRLRRRARLERRERERERDRRSEALLAAFRERRERERRSFEAWRERERRSFDEWLAAYDRGEVTLGRVSVEPGPLSWESPPGDPVSDIEALIERLVPGAGASSAPSGTSAPT